MSGKTKNSQSFAGYIILTSVLLIGSLTTLLIVGLAFRSLGGLEDERFQENATIARAMSNACVEEALRAIIEAASYAGGVTLTLGSYSCDILPVIRSGNNYTIPTQSSVGGVTKKNLILSQRGTGIMRVDSWQDVPDF